MADVSAMDESHEVAASGAVGVDAFGCIVIRLHLLLAGEVRALDNDSVELAAGGAAVVGQCAVP